MNPNQVIHEAMGRCWHELDGEIEDDGAYRSGCVLCGADNHDCNWPDFTTPEGFFRAWNWAKGEEWWLKFLNQNGWVDCPVNYIKASLIDPPVFAEELARFLEGRG